jgi:hypothetical protein
MTSLPLPLTRQEELQIIEYYHTARAAGYDSRVDRVNYAVRWFIKEHPEWESFKGKLLLFMYDLLANAL